MKKKSTKYIKPMISDEEAKKISVKQKDFEDVLKRILKVKKPKSWK